MLPSFAQAFASDNMSTTLPPIRKRAVKTTDDESVNINAKKRRLTHSPHPPPHPLRTDLDNISNAPKLQSNSTPISPIGFTVQREMIDQVRSVKQIRKKQEALIEQRRGSTAGLGDDPAVQAKNALQQQNQPLQSRQEQGQQQQTSTLSISNTTSTSSPQTQTQIQTSLPPSSASGPSSSRLPPPPISFANRAISAGKKKPADLHLINPRDSTSHYPFHPSASRHLGLYGSSLQPAIQSAPPSQNSFSFPMALPRLPVNLISSGPPPSVAGGGRVPPTPTRLSMQGNSGSSGGSNIANGKISPASIPIASTLVPHTPTTLAMNKVAHFGNSLLAHSQLHPPWTSQHHPLPQNPSASGSSAPAPATAATAAQAKQAFLAPFELFYDALHDARQLKDWLNEQLTRTAVLMKRWEEQQNQLQSQRVAATDTGSRTRSGAKEKTVVKREEGEGEVEGLAEPGEELGIREELERLRRRVEDLEARLAATATTTTASSSSSTSSNSSHEGYTFPQQQQPPQQFEKQYHQRDQYDHREQHEQSLQQPPTEREQQHQEYQQPQRQAPPASTSLALPPLPAISGRLAVSGRPELGRRLSSPGWQPSSSRGSTSGGRAPYRMAGRGGRGGDAHGLDSERDSYLDREREGRNDPESGRGGLASFPVSKSLSGPGTSGGGQLMGPAVPSTSSGGSNSRRGRSRRGSISGVLPAKDREPEPEAEFGPGERTSTGRTRVGREEQLERDGEGGMNVDSVVGVDGGRDREREGEKETDDREREQENEGRGGDESNT